VVGSAEGWCTGIEGWRVGRNPTTVATSPTIVPLFSGAVVFFLNKTDSAEAFARAIDLYGIRRSENPRRVCELMGNHSGKKEAES
jgi:hypothetical protein